MNGDAIVQAVAWLEAADFSCHLLRRRDGNWSCEIYDRHARSTRHYHGFGSSMDVAITAALTEAETNLKRPLTVAVTDKDDELDVSEFL